MFVLYGVAYALITNGQLNGKVFIQNELFKIFNENLTVTYLSFIFAISRIMRIMSNMAFGKIYYKLKDKVGVLLITLLSLAFVFLCIGFYINTTLILKFAIMAVGFFIILAVRDPIKLYFQDLLLKHTEIDKQQSALTWLHFSRKLGVCVLGLIISATLLQVEMIYVMIGMFVLSIVTIFSTIKLYTILKNNKQQKEKLECVMN